MIYEFCDLLEDITVCDRAIQYFKGYNPKDLQNDTSYFVGRTIPIMSISDIPLKNELKVILYKLSQKLYKIHDEFIFPEFSDIVHWAPNQDMGVHIDDGLETLKQRHYTAVCYLNDDYSGGETFLPEHNYYCKPEKGKVIAFPSNYPHGVTTVQNNSRYTMAMWFTKDKNFAI